MRSKAELQGTILYINGRLWADDVTPDEAVEILGQLKDYPDAPLGVRIPTQVKRYRKQFKS